MLVMITLMMLLMITRGWGRMDEKAGLPNWALTCLTVHPTPYTESTDRRHQHILEHGVHDQSSFGKFIIFWSSPLSKAKRFSTKMLRKVGPKIR